MWITYGSMYSIDENIKREYDNKISQNVFKF